jgi:predicted DNA-binding protein YlxM (UPF0122 family)
VFHEGFALKQYIEKNNVSLNEIAALLGISRSAVYGIYGNEVIHSEYKDKFKTSKHKIPGITDSNGGHNISNDFNKDLEHCREMLKAKDEIIEILRAAKR